MDDYKFLVCEHCDGKIYPGDKYYWITEELVWCADCIHEDVLEEAFFEDPYIDTKVHELMEEREGVCDV